MSTIKIYSYYELTPMDVIENIEWARANFDYYDGEISPLWSQHVQEEFVRIRKERNSERNKNFLANYCI